MHLPAVRRFHRSIGSTDQSSTNRGVLDSLNRRSEDLPARTGHLGRFLATIARNVLSICGAILTDLLKKAASIDGSEHAPAFARIPIRRRVRNRQSGGLGDDADSEYATVRGPSIAVSVNRGVRSALWLHERTAPIHCAADCQRLARLALSTSCRQSGENRLESWLPSVTCGRGARFGSGDGSLRRFWDPRRSQSADCFSTRP
jgi:hypothetical protein